MSNKKITINEIQKISDKIVSLGFEKQHTSYFYKAYQGVSDIYGLYGIINIHVEEWSDTEMVIEIQYPKIKLNLTQKGISSLDSAIDDFISISEEMNSDLEKLYELFDSCGSSLEEAVEIHDKLNPKIWTEDKELIPEVRAKILQIVDKFKNQLAVDGVDLKIDDIYLLGSNANFNYNEDSDLDLHIIADESFDCSEEHLAIIYNCYKALFNNKYDIRIKGINVEIYVENKDKLTNVSAGIYSLNDGWIRNPSQYEIPEFDQFAVDKGVQVWEDRYYAVTENPTIAKIDDYINSIYELRQESIKKDGEFGEGNLIFKEIRRLGYLDELKQLKVDLTSQELSLESLNENVEDKDILDMIQKETENLPRISREEEGVPSTIDGYTGDDGWVISDASHCATVISTWPISDLKVKELDNGNYMISSELEDFIFIKENNGISNRCLRRYTKEFFDKVKDKKAGFYSVTKNEKDVFAKRAKELVDFDVTLEPLKEEKGPEKYTIKHCFAKSLRDKHPDDYYVVCTTNVGTNLEKGWIRTGQSWSGIPVPRSLQYCKDWLAKNNITDYTVDEDSGIDFDGPLPSKDWKEYLEESKEKIRYYYHGPLHRFEALFRHEWEGYTEAVSEAQAINNLNQKAKKEFGFTPDAKLNIDPQYLEVSEKHPNEDDFRNVPEIKKCEKCGRQLNDSGECPECDLNDESVLDK